MRTPNSCRRWLTENDITPYIPTAASTIATSAEDREHGRDDPVLRDEAVDLRLRRADEIQRQVRVRLLHLARGAPSPSRPRAGRRAASETMVANWLTNGAAMSGPTGFEKNGT